MRDSIHIMNMYSGFFSNTVVNAIQEKRLSIDTAWNKYKNYHEQFEKRKSIDKWDMFNDFQKLYYTILESPKLIMLYDSNEEYLTAL